MAAEWSVGQLARAGLTDLDVARELLETPVVAALADSGDEHDLLADLSLAADPDQACDCSLASWSRAHHNCMRA